MIKKPAGVPAVTKRKRGRPRVLERVYHSGMCDRVIEVGKRGGSTTAMAVACGVHRRVMRKWTKRHAEFGVAYERARLHAQVYWEELGKAHMHDATFNESVWLRIMQRFDEYQQAPRHHRFRGSSHSVPAATALMQGSRSTSTP
jgi:hypothetical protein